MQSRLKVLKMNFPKFKLNAKIVFLATSVVLVLLLSTLTGSILISGAASGIGSIGTSNTAAPVGISSQRHVVYSQGLWWTFWGDGSNIFIVHPRTGSVGAIQRWSLPAASALELIWTST